MSYPNSGTTYTIHLIEQSTQTTVATNYAQEPRKRGYDVKPLYVQSPEGPFIHNTTLALPRTPYIMTKTHCSGYCSECPQNRYVINKNKFLKACSECNNNGIRTSYEKNIVPSKTIRLVRNPLDNVVSNFHHWQMKQRRQNKTALTDDDRGFKQYCRIQNEKYDAIPANEKKPKLKKVQDFFAVIPCHQSFFRYVQWHNNAERITQPTLVVYYDDYERDFEQTTKDILLFLEIDAMFPKPIFKAGKTYDFFTAKERKAVWNLVKTMALPSFWDKVKKYES